METLFYIRDAESGEPVPGAAIYVPGTAIGKITGANGQATMEIAAGSTVTIDALGYIAQTQQITGGTAAITVDLEADPSLPSVTVAARRPRKLLIVGLLAVVIYLIWKL